MSAAVRIAAAQSMIGTDVQANGAHIRELSAPGGVPHVRVSSMLHAVSVTLEAPTSARREERST